MACVQSGYGMVKVTPAWDSGYVASLVLDGALFVGRGSTAEEAVEAAIVKAQIGKDASEGGG